ncbi:MAG: HK97 gp10 family phage protein [Mogibacterium sp.]|nr:HK97 gp10 family phage protein [Mogibacterium sp.]
MSSVLVNSSKFSITVSKFLDEYSDDVSKAVYVCADEATANARDKLRNAGDFKGKKFRKAWTRTIRQKSFGAVDATVHLKKPYYRIGHLLEFEHASRNGGRVRGYHFIEPIANECNEEFEQKLIEMIGLKL